VEEGRRREEEGRRGKGGKGGEVERREWRREIQIEARFNRTRRERTSTSLHLLSTSLHLLSIAHRGEVPRPSGALVQVSKTRGKDGQRDERE